MNQANQPNDLGIPGLGEIRRVGSGGFADVYEARDEFGRAVAVKLLKVLDERVSRRFDRERTAMGQVAGHPNIVTPFTSGYTTPDEKPFVVMEYLGGGSLQDLLNRRGPLPIAEAIGLIVPIAEALAFSHNAGIVHKDVKPGNILLTTDGIPKLADFGISSIRDATATTSVGYSLDFTPPETFHGSNTADGDPRDARSDIYSLAATLYSLISGHGPFHSDTNATAAGYMARILHDPVPPTGSAALDVALAQAMAKDPAHRFPTADAFAQALRSIPADGGAGTAAAPPPQQPAANPPLGAFPPPQLSSTPTNPSYDPQRPATVVSPPPAAFVPPRPAGDGSLNTDRTQVAGRSDSVAPPAGRGRLLLVGGVAGVLLLLGAGVVAWQGLGSGGGGAGEESPIDAGALDDAAATETNTDDATTDDTVDDGATTDDGTEDGGTDEPEPIEPTDDGEAEAEALGTLPDFAGSGQTIRVAVLPNPDIDDLEELTPTEFTAETNVNVEFVLMDDGEIGDILTASTGEFDAVMIGMYNTPQFGSNGWLLDLSDFAANTPAWQIDDIVPSVLTGLSHAGSLYAAPFYAESSMLMYRQDVLDEFGVTMPNEPTWQEVAEIARTIDRQEMAGICLRGRPGWGDLGASFGTVLNTFGATWWAAEADGSIGTAQVDQPEFREAFQFYVDLANDAGQDDVANSSFVECLNLYQNGEVAMWYDATVASYLLEGNGSPVQGLNGFAQAPTAVTDASGWLWAWSLAIPANAPDPEAAWAFVSWASSREYTEARAERFGWEREFTDVRLSTFDNPGFQSAYPANVAAVRQALVASPIERPGTTPRPGTAGVQYVGVPEFQSMGNDCTIELSSAIAGVITVDEALSRCQTIAAQSG